MEGGREGGAERGEGRGEEGHGGEEGKGREGREDVMVFRSVVDGVDRFARRRRRRRQTERDRRGGGEGGRWGGRGRGGRRISYYMDDVSILHGELLHGCMEADLSALEGDARRNGRGGGGEGEVVVLAEGVDQIAENNVYSYAVFPRALSAGEGGRGGGEEGRRGGGEEGRRGGGEEGRRGGGEEGRRGEVQHTRWYWFPSL